jgi:Protein of unknown function (DUF5818)
MKKIRALLQKLPAMAVMVGLCLVCQSAIAQYPPSQSSPTAQQPPAQGQDSAAETKTFTGMIVKSGDNLVLADAESGTTFQLDDQQKAQEFVGKKVKVSGVLDTASGMIRVSAIEPV